MPWAPPCGKESSTTPWPWSVSQPHHSSTPSPLRALAMITRAVGLTPERLARNSSRSKSRCGSRSILFTTTTSAARNMTGYFSGFSSPSVTEKTIARASSPTRNSAGHTRLPTFSIIRRSSSGNGRRSRPDRTITASRWHSPPNPALVLTTEMAAAPAPWRRSASRLVAMSPSSTPMRTEPPSISRDLRRSVVFPAPGDDMRFTARTPAAASRARCRQRPGRSPTACSPGS